MKTSKIIFSMAIIAMVLMSMTSNAQTRVTINAGIVPPYPPNIYYAPQPVYPPGYYAPGFYYGPYGHPHHAYYYNHPYGGYGYRRGQGYRNHPHYY